MLITSTEIYDNSLYKQGNIIISTDVQAVSGFRDFGARIMGVFGGTSDLMDKKIKDVVETAMKRFTEKLQLMNAKGAIGLTTDVNAFVDREQVYIIATISGTPLLSRNAQGGRRRR
jgi:uncharacterized protein YbjQ (UPF0145 family)